MTSHHRRSRSFTDQVHFYFSLTFTLFNQSILPMLSFYLDSMTGFYLCFMNLLLLIALSSLHFRILSKSICDISSSHDDVSMSKSNVSHFCVASVLTMNSTVQRVSSIPTVISSLRPRANALYINKQRQRVLRYLPNNTDSNYQEGPI